jgi:pumilio family protein 6
MCQSDEAQLVIFSALDIIEFVAASFIAPIQILMMFACSDTKLTGKSLLTDLTSHASTLVKTAQGRRALLYPLVGRARRHFTPALVKALAETDPIRAKTSKKDAGARADEVRKAASEGLLAWVEKEGAEAVRETAGSLVVVDVMLYADGGEPAEAYS